MECKNATPQITLAVTYFATAMGKEMSSSSISSKMPVSSKSSSKPGPSTVTIHWWVPLVDFKFIQKLDDEFLSVVSRRFLAFLDVPEDSDLGDICGDIRSKDFD